MEINKFGACLVTDVESLEKRYNIKLPKDYFEFLCNIGGGVVTSNCEVYIKSLDDVISVDVLYGINTEYKNANIDIWMDKYQGEIPEGTIIIGDTLEHGFIVLLCVGDDEGVYYWDDTYFFPHSSYESNTFFITDSFPDFINSMK